MTLRQTTSLIAVLTLNAVATVALAGSRAVDRGEDRTDVRAAAKEAGQAREGVLTSRVLSKETMGEITAQKSSLFNERIRLESDVRTVNQLLISRGVTREVASAIEGNQKLADVSNSIDHQDLMNLYRLADLKRSLAVTAINNLQSKITLAEQSSAPDKVAQLETLKAKLGEAQVARDVASYNNALLGNARRPEAGPVGGKDLTPLKDPELKTLLRQLSHDLRVTNRSSLNVEMARAVVP